MNKKIIVVTVPHAGCDSSSGSRNEKIVRAEERLARDYLSIDRMCDRRSLAAALTLVNILEAKGAEVVLFANETVERSWCDINRLHCGTGQAHGIPAMHVAINAFLEKNRDRVAWHVDMHSFPSQQLIARPDLTTHMYALLLDNQSQWQKAALIHEYMGAGMDVLQGSDVNALSYMFEERGIRSVLVEVEEDPRDFPMVALQRRLSSFAQMLLNN